MSSTIVAGVVVEAAGGRVASAEPRDDVGHRG